MVNPVLVGASSWLAACSRTDQITCTIVIPVLAALLLRVYFEASSFPFVFDVAEMAHRAVDVHRVDPVGPGFGIDGGRGALLGELHLGCVGRGLRNDRERAGARLRR